MNNLNGRILRGLLLLTLIAAFAASQADAQRNAHRRLRPAATPHATPHAQAPKFHLDCTLPALTTTPLAIDKSCGNTGNSPANSANAKQNEVKNRFCLPGAPTTPVVINFSTFDTLMQEAVKRHIPFGQKKIPGSIKPAAQLPPDRSVLTGIITDSHGHQLGEGTLVTLEGFVLSSHHSNTFVFHFDGESVNCNKNNLASNDIHIVLASTQSETNECKTVTAEISPHHRSADYNQFVTDPADFRQGPKQGPGDDRLTGHPLPLERARVRVTGQLFFDASHSPCGINHGAQSRRRSIWEIHPVYAIEVFDTTLKTFLPFEKWKERHSQ